VAKKGPTIRKHAHGGYRTTFQGKTIYGSSEEEVMDKYIDARYKAGQGYNVKDNPTLEIYALQWFDTYKRGKKAIKTQEMYANALNNHILPALGDKKIKDIVTSDIQALLNASNSSHSLQSKVKTTLNQIFNKALGDRLVPVNPVVGTERVETPDPIRNFYTPEQREIIYEVLQNMKVFPLVFTILNTGMRATEAIALIRNRDLDLEHNRIHVRESTQFKKSKPKKAPTKSDRGVRVIPIPSGFSAWMQEYLKSVKSLYVFPHHTGGQMSRTTLANLQRNANNKLARWFDRHPDKEEHRFKLHYKTLRHTYCTELFDLGVDEMMAAKIMGHDVSIMREVYTHIQKGREEQTVDTIENLYSDKIIKFPVSKKEGKSV